MVFVPKQPDDCSPLSDFGSDADYSPVIEPQAELELPVETPTQLSQEETKDLVIDGLGWDLEPSSVSSKKKKGKKKGRVTRTVPELEQGFQS